MKLGLHDDDGPLPSSVLPSLNSEGDGEFPRESQGSGHVPHSRLWAIAHISYLDAFFCFEPCTLVYTYDFGGLRNQNLIIFRSGAFKGPAVALSEFSPESGNIIH